MSVLTYESAGGKARLTLKDLIQGVATGILILAVVLGVGVRNWLETERNKLLLFLVLLALLFLMGLVQPVS